MTLTDDGKPNGKTEKEKKMNKKLKHKYKLTYIAMLKLPILLLVKYESKVQLQGWFRIAKNPDVCLLVRLRARVLQSSLPSWFGDVRVLICSFCRSVECLRNGISGLNLNEIASGT